MFQNLLLNLKVHFAYIMFQVTSVINSRPRLQKISFVSHSLGGLVARYAIGRLYRHNTTRVPDEENRDGTPEESGSPVVASKSEGSIAGLEPINFITLATPHLGSRGHKQVMIYVINFSFVDIIPLKCTFRRIK